MTEMKQPRLLTPKETYTVDYEQALEFINTQMSIFWLPDEIKVEKDLHDFKTAFNEAEMHGVITTLKLFTLYEVLIGTEYWQGYVAKNFPRPADIERMANCFSFFELNVHGPFYNKLNEVLGLNTDEFYSDYVNDETLKNRIQWIHRMLEKASNDDSPVRRLKSLAIFSIIEGAILYSSFAFLRHFVSNGKNILVNVNAGIAFSVKDESIHAEAGAWLYKTLMQEYKDLDMITDAEILDLNEEIKSVVEVVLEHEARIIDMIFEKGQMKGITDVQLKHFVESRLDVCLQNLGINKMFKPSYNPIKDWFYDNINMPSFNDFFVKVGSSYNRNWSEKNFIWNTNKVEK